MRSLRDYKKLTDNMTKITEILPDMDLFIKSGKSDSTS